MTGIGTLLAPDVQALIREKRWETLRDALAHFDPADVAEVLVEVPDEDDVAVFRVLPRDLAAKVFAHLPPDHQERLLHSLSGDQMRYVLGGMAPDDQARLLEELPAEVTRRILAALSPDELRSARDLLGYPPGSAGRYMTPRYVSLSPDMTAAEALDYVRRAGRDQETLAVLYAVGTDGILRKEIRLGTLVLADPAARVIDIPERPPVSVTATASREEAVAAFRKYDRVALPVTDRDGKMLGILTADDILDVAERETTEDIQRAGGMEALDAPYLEVGFLRMMWKRGGWLSVLFLGEMLTATAMTYFEGEIAKAVVLAMFVPLIISSGGNSGSQAATLIVRAMALTEVRLRDWLRVLGREARTGLALGMWLGSLGFARVETWQHLGFYDYGPHHALIGLTVWASLIGVVSFGSVAGAMLPFLLRRAGADPATCSAPFVATLVDVTGLIIYFTVAALILAGTVL